MGSRGTGRFGDYKPSGDTNKCDQPIKGVRLEDVGLSEYYQNHQSVPDRDHDVQVREILHNKRIVVETLDMNEVVGALPTKYNYLAVCLKAGKKYSGKIIASSNNPIPIAEVDLDVI